MHPLLALYSLVMVTLLLVSVKANPIHFHAEHLFRRDASGQSIASLRTGVLVKNGVQTSCELALIDNKAAFVAANCVTDVNGKLDTINGYSVYYDDSNVQGNKAASASITSSSITVHPGYSTDTLANNIAILQFNPGQGVSWKNAIAVNSNAWSDTVLARRRLANVKGSQWATPLTESLSASADQCSSSSGLYAANTKDFVCSSQESVPLMSSQCNIPYGSVYGVQGTNAAIAGLYSFSVVNGGQFCSSSTVTSYYLLLADYISFAQDAIGRDVTLSFDQGYTLNNIITYSMNQGSFSSPSGTLVLTGNVFATNGNSANWVYGSYFGSQTPQSSNNNSGGSSSAQGSSGTSIASGVLIDELLSKSSALAVPTGSDSINSASESNSNNNSNGGDTSDINNNAANNAIGSDSSPSYSAGASNANNGESKDSTGKSDKDSLSGGDIAAIVICLLIGIVLIAAGLFFGSRWYRQYNLRRRWAPDTVRNIVETQTVENELGSETPAKFELPSYRQHRHTMLVAAGPMSPQ